MICQPPDARWRPTRSVLSRYCLMNRSLDAETATAVSGIFTEAVIAPNASDAAQAIMAKKPNLRLLLTGAMPPRDASDGRIKSVAGGFWHNLIVAPSPPSHCKSSLRAPTDAEINDMLFAWRVTKHVKSNAIVFVKDRITAGIGAGQMSRVDSARSPYKRQDTATKQGWQSPARLDQSSHRMRSFLLPTGWKR